MKRGFIKILWGIHDHQQRRAYLRRTKIDNDIELTTYNKYHEPFTVYVFGEDNYKYLQDKGFNCRLIDKNPIVWPLETKQFRHKLEAFKYASEDFDEFVFTDWDMMFIKPLPIDFWDMMYKKDIIQAILRVYNKQIVNWRTNSRRTVSCGSFIYIREKHVADGLIKCWEDIVKINTGVPYVGEEVAISKYTDDLMGGKFDQNIYWERFEPLYFKLQNMYSDEKMKTKISIIEHLNHHGVSSYLNQIKNNTISVDWLRREK